MSSLTKYLDFHLTHIKPAMHNWFLCMIIYARVGNMQWIDTYNFHLKFMLEPPILHNKLLHMILAYTRFSSQNLFTRAKTIVESEKERDWHNWNLTLPISVLWVCSYLLKLLCLHTEGLTWNYGRVLGHLWFLIFFFF